MSRSICAEARVSVNVMNRPLAVRTLALALISTLTTACARYDGVLRAEGGNAFTPPKISNANLNVAIDDESCIALLLFKQKKRMAGQIKDLTHSGITSSEILKFHPELSWQPPPGVDESLAAAVAQRKIRVIPVGLRVVTLKTVYSEYGRIVPEKSHTGYDENIRGSISGEWVEIVSSPLTGRKVCLDPDSVLPRYGPWP